MFLWLLLHRSLFDLWKNVNKNPSLNFMANFGILKHMTIKNVCGRLDRSQYGRRAAAQYILSKRQCNVRVAMFFAIL
jgi:hypothetical protein